MVIIYDRYFNGNEWFILITLTISLIIIFKLKRMFTTEEAMVYFFCSIFIGMLADHTISVPPFDFYDVNDTSKYEFFDFLTYFMYGPFGYMYIYIYNRFRLKVSYAPLYVLAWAVISLLMELLSDYMGIFHYKNGYKIYYSFPIYLLTLSFQLCLYKFLNTKDTQ